MPAGEKFEPAHVGCYGILNSAWATGRVPHGGTDGNSSPGFILGWTIGASERLNTVMDDKDTVMTIETPVLEILKKKTRHAGYWEALCKQDKEVLIVRDLLIAIHHCENRIWVTSIQPGPCAKESPDVVGATKEGGRVAFEVMELVDQTMVERRARAQAIGKARKFQLDPRSQQLSRAGNQATDKAWKPDELIGWLQSKINDKELKIISKKDFKSIVLVIHTAERELRPGVFGPAIAAHRFVRRGQFHEAYLIFPPGGPHLLHQPEPRFCRYVRLSF